MIHDQVKYWDGLSSFGSEASVIDPNDVRGYKNGYIVSIRNRVIEAYFSDLRDSGFVLDFGCGSGNISNTLSLIGCSSIGIDISEKLLGLATEVNFSETSLFVRYDGTTIPLAENSAGGAVTYVVLGHIIDQSILESLLRQIYSVLSVGGVFVCIEQTRKKTILTDSGYKIQRTKRDYRLAFENAGFEVSRIFDIRSGHNPFLYLLRYGLTKKFSLINMVETALLKCIKEPILDYRDTVFILTKL